MSFVRSVARATPNAGSHFIFPVGAFALPTESDNRPARRYPLIGYLIVCGGDVVSRHSSLLPRFSGSSSAASTPLARLLSLCRSPPGTAARWWSAMREKDWCANKKEEKQRVPSSADLDSHERKDATFSKVGEQRDDSSTEWSHQSIRAHFQGLLETGHRATQQPGLGFPMSVIHV